VDTEDHPLEYLTFRRRHPRGELRSGTVTVWDTGAYHPEKIEDRKLVVVLDGKRARGPTPCS
jgi:ATP-dependent DNA ligase